MFNALCFSNLNSLKQAVEANLGLSFEIKELMGDDLVFKMQLVDPSKFGLVSLFVPQLSKLSFSRAVDLTSEEFCSLIKLVSDSCYFNHVGLLDGSSLDVEYLRFY